MESLKKYLTTYEHMLIQRTIKNKIGTLIIFLLDGNGEFVFFLFLKLGF